jgi:hypothetical protein
VSVKIPTVHLNGTSGESLEERAFSAVQAVSSAIDAMCEAGPNARDYYMQGDTAAFDAQREHEDRVKRLKMVRDELREIWEGVRDQIEERDARRKAR